MHTGIPCESKQVPSAVFPSDVSKYVSPDTNEVYTCPSAYNTNQVTASCLPDGRWSAEPPTCEGKNCVYRLLTMYDHLPQLVYCMVMVWAKVFT